MFEISDEPLWAFYGFAKQVWPVLWFIIIIIKLFEVLSV